MAIVNINTVNDCDFVRQFQYLINEPITNGTMQVPFDLTGAQLHMGVRVNASDREEELLLSTETGSITIDDAVNGLFTITIPQATLLLLPVGSYVHSLIRVMVFPDKTFRYRVWSGTFTNNWGPSR